MKALVVKDSWGRKIQFLFLFFSNMILGRLFFLQWTVLHLCTHRHHNQQGEFSCPVAAFKKSLRGLILITKARLMTHAYYQLTLTLKINPYLLSTLCHVDHGLLLHFLHILFPLLLLVSLMTLPFCFLTLPLTQYPQFDHPAYSLPGYRVIRILLNQFEVQILILYKSTNKLILEIYTDTQREREQGWGRGQRKLERVGWI